MEDLVLKCPLNEGMFVKVLRDSISAGTRLRIITLQVRMPRIIWPEILTHRAFGRNGRSSRAVPAKWMLEEVMNDPFIPWRWTGEKSGMQGIPDFSAPVESPFPNDNGEYPLLSPVELHLLARDQAVAIARAYAAAGYHKQVFNRYLEPYMWIDGIITSSQWRNFLWLRNHGDAEPHLIDLAELIREALAISVPRELRQDEWHMPYIKEDDEREAVRRYAGSPDLVRDFLLKVSAARCARVSYTPFNNDSTYEAEIKRYDFLVKSERVHASPLEHQATPDSKNTDGAWANADLHGNLPGFVQARKLVYNNFMPD